MLLLPLSGEVKSSNDNSITNIRTLYFTSDTHDSTSNTNSSTMKVNNSSNSNSNNNNRYDKTIQNKAKSKVYPENRSSDNLTISISTTDDIKAARNSVIALLSNKGNQDYQNNYHYYHFITNNNNSLH